MNATLQMVGVDDARLLDSKVDRCLDEANEKAAAFYDAMLDVRRAEAWRPLGFQSWAAYAESKIGKARRTVYERLEAAAVVRELKVVRHAAQNDVPVEPDVMPVRQLKALAKAPEGTRAEVLGVAVKAADGRPTEKTVKAAVSARNARPEATPAELVEATRTIVNGEARTDPSVERDRAAGIIPADAKVVVEDPGEEAGDSIEAAREEYAERAAKADDLTDEEWLATLPLTSQLSGLSLSTFRADALYYRRFGQKLRGSLMAFNGKASKECNQKRYGGAVWFYVQRLLRVQEPKDWKVCPPPDKGGCGGAGTIPIVGECDKCHGRGYTVAF